jgi:hypothetical protein
MKIGNRNKKHVYLTLCNWSCILPAFNLGQLIKFKFYYRLTRFAWLAVFKYVLTCLPYLMRIQLVVCSLYLRSPHKFCVMNSIILVLWCSKKKAVKNVESPPACGTYGLRQLRFWSQLFFHNRLQTKLNKTPSGLQSWQYLNWQTLRGLGHIWLYVL